MATKFGGSSGVADAGDSGGIDDNDQHRRHRDLSGVVDAPELDESNGDDDDEVDIDMTLLARHQSAEVAISASEEEKDKEGGEDDDDDDADAKMEALKASERDRRRSHRSTVATSVTNNKSDIKQAGAELSLNQEPAASSTPTARSGLKQPTQKQQKQYPLQYEKKNLSPTAEKRRHRKQSSPTTKTTDSSSSSSAVLKKSMADGHGRGAHDRGPDAVSKTRESISVFSSTTGSSAAATAAATSSSSSRRTSSSTGASTTHRQNRAMRERRRMNREVNGGEDDDFAVGYLDDDDERNDEMRTSGRGDEIRSHTARSRRSSTNNDSDSDYDDEFDDDDDDSAPPPVGAVAVTNGVAISQQPAVLAIQPVLNENAPSYRPSVTLQDTDGSSRLDNRQQTVDEETPLDNNGGGLQEQPTQHDRSKIETMTWYQKHRRAVLISIVVFVLVAIGAGVGVAVSSKDDNDESATASSSSSSTTTFVDPSPTEAPLIIDPIKRDVFEKLILDQGISDMDEWNNVQSNVFKAYEWLVAEDTLIDFGYLRNTSLVSTTLMELVQDDSQVSFFVTRYILAVLYYSLGGSDWFSSERWLDPTVDHCQWQFVECANNLNPNGIQEVTRIRTQVQVGLDPDSGLNIDGNLPVELSYLWSLGTSFR